MGSNIAKDKHIKNMQEIKIKKFFTPKIINIELSKPNIAFLDNVKKIKQIKNKIVKNKINFLQLNVLYLEIRNNNRGSDIDNQIPV